MSSWRGRAWECETHIARLSSTGLISRDGRRRSMNGGHSSRLLAYTWGPAWVKVPRDIRGFMLHDVVISSPRDREPL